MNGLSFVLLLILTSGAAVVIHTDPQPQAVLIGGVVNMTCVIEASYNISIEWLKDDIIIETTSKPFLTITTTPPSSDVGNYTSTLSISSVWFDSCGKYMCSASGMNSAAVDVNVVELASYSDPSPISSVGEVGMLSCTVRRCGDFTILWNISSNEGSALPFPITTDTSIIATNIEEVTSMITITPLGVANRGPAQACVIQYKEKKFTSQLFDYTFQMVTNCSGPSLSVAECEVPPSDSADPTSSTTECNLTTAESVMVGTIILIFVVAFVTISVVALIVLCCCCKHIFVRKHDR
jgi:hypothetical protein